MKHRASLIVIHFITIIILAFLSFIFFSFLNRGVRHSISTDVPLFVMIYFITFTISSGIYRYFLNRYTILWNILSSVCILAFVFCFGQFTWGWDWANSKTFIGFLFYVFVGWIYPEVYKIIKRLVIRSAS